MRIVFLGPLDEPYVVTDSALVSTPTERKEGKQTVYGKAQYTALEARPATREELRRWRSQ